MFRHLFGRTRTRAAGLAPLPDEEAIMLAEVRDWLARGAQLFVGGNLREAEAAFGEALAADADHPEALNNIAVLHMQGDLRKAVEKLRRAQARAPQDPVIQINLGLALFSLRQFEAARACYLRALHLAPGNMDARRALANLDLALGRFDAQTWGHFQMRRLHADFPGYHLLADLPYLQAEILPRERLLVHLEQGLGDEIFFASCIGELREHAAAVAVTCDARLQRLLSAALPGVTVIASSPGWETQARAFGAAAQVFAGDLPYWLRRGIASFPRAGGYLRADPARARHWAARLRKLGPGLKVGISWRGGLPATGRDRRSIPLWEWAGLFGQPGVQWIDLQYGEHGQEMRAAQSAGVPVTRFEDAMADYDETAALISQLDLVISVTTAVVDLAGALDVPCWVLVPSRPIWKFGVAGERTPWYPALRVFHQEVDEPWSGVLARAEQALAGQPIVRRARARAQTRREVPRLAMPADA